MARTIIVGDVHGCAVELEALLERVGLTRHDRLVFVGDVVARGPDSRRVLGIIRSTRARVVRGNHEERLIAARAARAEGKPGPRLGQSHEKVYASFDDEDWALIESWPLKLDLEEHGIRVVHAGVTPGVAWERQDPWLVTHIRSISDTGEPSERWGTPWGSAYRGPPHVVFGHNAQKLVQLHPDATGIDTACVYGGELTAFVLSEREKPPPIESRRDALISVPAHTPYADYGRALRAE